MSYSFPSTKLHPSFLSSWSLTDCRFLLAVACWNQSQRGVQCCTTILLVIAFCRLWIFQFPLQTAWNTVTVQNTVFTALEHCESCKIKLFHNTWDTRKGVTVTGWMSSCKEKEEGEVASFPSLFRLCVCSKGRSRKCIHCFCFGNWDIPVGTLMGTLNMYPLKLQRIVGQGSPKSGIGSHLN